MSCYNYTHFIKQFADRTTENLQIIDSFSLNPDSKEVTQLINSFLGLLVVPSERYKESNEEKEREENSLKKCSPEGYRNIKNMTIQLRGQKKLFNDEYDITIRGIDVEMYVEDVKAATVSNGIYSLFEDE